MRTIRILVFLLLCAPTLWATDANRVLLRVNDRIATLYDYELRRDERLRAIQQADLDPARRADLVANVGAEVLSNILEELLVLSRADQIGFVPTEGEIDLAVARAKESFGIQTDAQFEQALASSGMTIDQFKTQVETNLRVSQVMGREVQQRISLSEEDLRRYYYENPQKFTTPERLRLQEIVVLDTSALSAEGRAELAAELRREMESGASLSELARDDATTSGMVELGWIEKGDLDPALEQAVWDLAVDGVSSPVEGRGGLHLLQVLEREQASLLAFSDVADDIERLERERLLMQEYDGYLQELRDAAYIRISQLPEDAKGFNVQESAARLTVESDLSGDSDPESEP